ncbi:pantoate--beta-alanine ligase [Nannochloropsis gaditana]|uniref:Pantoate--beta-alanine ligase n=1 Tax=Nannochloropsis gaditana TaxID=72520 RepID=W7U1N3_9STRA|nr:pantoate--beta-alanine ligase [Nannochloropsis gaditana]
MYTPSHRCYVVPEGFEHLAEGKSRPGHFKGVATIVTKLFGIVQPTKAYFGQKDAMQCVLMRRLVEDLNLPPAIVVCDTVREKDGLAMSSRNAYLSQHERSAAPVVYKSLRAAEQAFCNSETSISAAELRKIVRDVLAREELIHTVEYVSVARKDTMEELEDIVQPNEGAVISLAVRLGKVRLIDNVII